MPVHAPVVETERLILRQHRLDDFDACVAMWADLSVTRHISGKASSVQQTWARVLSYVGHWTLLGFGYWAMEDKASSRYVGELGFADFKRDIDPSLRDVPELGWALAADVHGRGYATEAVRAALEWGDAHLRQKRTVCIIDPENLASIRVAEKCNYREARRFDYNGRPTILFARATSAVAFAPSPSW